MIDADTRGLILIADDNPVNIELLFSTLSREQFELVVANDGNMVLDLVRQEEPDLVLLDVMMPGMDGFETCRRLKADPSTKDIPIIFMTSLDATSDRLQGFNLGAVDYVVKPFEERELLARVRTQLGLRRMTRALTEKNNHLEEQIRRREEIEAALAERSHQLTLRTEELSRANARLERELLEREDMERARAALQDEIIAVQRQRLIELSTPLIPVTGTILVLPLIGTMDAERMQQVLEAVLHGATERGAEFVIIDVTGAKGIDGDAPEMLVRVSEGLRLLGARTILTGLRPDAARVFAQLQTSFGAMVTKASLQDGISYAMGSSPRARRASKKA